VAVVFLPVSLRMSLSNVGITMRETADAALVVPIRAAVRCAQFCA